MSFAHSQERRSKRYPHAACIRHQERFSDCWPDFSTELAEDAHETLQRKNSVGAVLKEAAGAILYSAGLVLLLMTVLQLLHKG